MAIRNLNQDQNQIDFCSQGIKLNYEATNHKTPTQDNFLRILDSILPSVQSVDLHEKRMD